VQLFRGECEGCEEYVLSRGCGQQDDGERVCRFVRWGGGGGGRGRRRIGGSSRRRRRSGRAGESLHIGGSFRVAEQTKRGVFAQMWRSRAWIE